MIEDLSELDLGVFLRPVTNTDVLWIFELETHPDVIWRFRLGGMTPPFSQYARLLFATTLDQAIVVSASDRQTIGYVYADKYDPMNGTAEFGLVASRQSLGSGLVLHGMLLFMDRLFRQFNLRKLIGEMLEFNASQFTNKSGVEDFSQMVKFEGHFPNFYFLDGRYWDRYQIAIFRDTWEAHRPEMAASALRRYERTVVESAAEATEVTLEVPEIHLESSEFRLRAVAPADEPWCAGLVETSAAQGSLRYAAMNSGPDELNRQLWAGVVCQFIAQDRANGFPVGLLTAFDIGSANLTGYVHALIPSGYVRLPICHEPLVLFVDYVFSCWPLRTLFISYGSSAPELDAWKEAFTIDGKSAWQRVAHQKAQLNLGGSLMDREIWQLERNVWASNRQLHLST